MPSLYETDVVNSATRLECRLGGVHPRLFLDEAGIQALKAKCQREPWAGMLRRVRAMAAIGCPREGRLPRTGDIRGIGSALANLAVACRMTDDPALLAQAREQIRLMLTHTDWTTSLLCGHWAHGMALAYDWLYHELDEPLRQEIRVGLLQRIQRARENVNDMTDMFPTCYTCNHVGVTHAGLMSAGCALWGDIPEVGPILRHELEKLRLMVEVLGDDGASPEGLPYGQYHLGFLLKSLVLARDLLDTDFFPNCRFLQNYPLFMTYCALPRADWSYYNAFLFFGDSDFHHWYGPDAHLRVIGAQYRDPRAQWLADATCADGINWDSMVHLALIFHDERVPSQAPDDLPTWRHFTDKDIVVQRQGWGPHDAVLALKCGPNSGHRARRYRQNISGGHMHPDAGHLVLFGAGDWLLVDGGYTQKFTRNRNTITINGQGQTGEGGNWFEDLEHRRGQPEGCLRWVGTQAGLPGAIADATASYPPALGLTRFLRHLIQVMPTLWLLVDELTLQAPAEIAWRFHGPRDFTPLAHDTWAQRGERGALRLLTLGPSAISSAIVRENTYDVHGQTRSLPTLRLQSATPTPSALLVTVLHPHPVGEEPALQATLAPSASGYTLTVTLNGDCVTLPLSPGQANPATPIYQAPSRG